MRKIESVTYGPQYPMGPMIIRQPLPQGNIEQLSPFILLHHAGPKEIQPNEEQGRLSPHPHKGFEPVTFVFSGEFFHKDSLGNEGFVKNGGVQWLNSGRGVLHSEGPSEAFVQSGGTMELIQLWINLPASLKYSEPFYQNLPLEMLSPIPVGNGIQLNLVSGEYAGFKGPGNSRTGVVSMMGWLDDGAELKLEFNKSKQVLIYVLGGEVLFNQTKKVKEFNLVSFEFGEGIIQMECITKARILVLAGDPIPEPMVSYGPFVMNSYPEIKQAMDEYHRGEFGVLDF